MLLPCLSLVQDGFCTRFYGSCPEAAKQKDRCGRLPLHHAVDDRETWSAGAESIYVAYPEAAFTTDLNGNLPSYFFPDGFGRNLKFQLEKKVVMECSN
jgi:hypothetical protein